MKRKAQKTLPFLAGLILSTQISASTPPASERYQTSDRVSALEAERGSGTIGMNISKDSIIKIEGKEVDYQEIESALDWTALREPIVTIETEPNTPKNLVKAVMEKLQSVSVKRIKLTTSKD